MQREISRRDLLKLGAATAVVPSALNARPARAAAVAVADPPGAYPAQLPVPASWIIKPFDNPRVTLGPSLFTANRDRVLSFLDAYPADRMLAIFRRNAGLDDKGAQPPGGWETADGNLRGHYAGHFLSALALAYAGGGGDAHKAKADYMVAALKECQDALAAQVGQQPQVTRVAGRVGNALPLGGDAQYVTLPANLTTGLTDITISLWVNLKAVTAYSRLFDFGSGTTRNMYLAVGTGGTSGPRFAMTTTGSNGEKRISGAAPLATGRWTHLAVTLSGSTATLYVDGAAVGANATMPALSALGATPNCWIGRSQYSDPNLNGTVDDFHVYSRALSAAEVGALAGGAAGAGDVAAYAFDEDGGATVHDASAHARDAAVYAGAAGPSHAGYLAAYPETQYIQLEQYATYPTIWAPWYTCHMIMRGLLDAYLYTGNQQALDVVLGMADWAHSRLAHLPREQLDRMWSIYIAGEYNAMPVVLADLHALTGDAKHLETAKCFINTALYQATVENRDILDGRHANQHIPQFMGYLQIFEQTEEPDFYAAAANFWEMVVDHRTYTDGGMAGSGEIFGARDVIAATINGNNAETCPVYNMLKLSRSLFFHTGDPAYMQYYERALYGQILASRRNTDSTTNPLLTYFVPMAPGSARSYGNLGTCCGGTGLESHAKFQDSIYFRSVDDTALYVNLYMPSKLSWPEKGLTVEQTTDYPTDPSGTVLLTVTGNARLPIHLRVPYWVEKGFSVKVNGAEQALDAEPGTYVTLDRDWHTGDTIAVAAPFTLRVERALDQPRLTQSIAYGPVPMVALSDETTYRDFTLDGDLSRSITPGADPMTFTTNGLTLRPFYVDDTARYHAYFHRVNRAPALAGDQTVDPGGTFDFHLGSDPDGDPCTYTVDGLPAGAHLDGSRLTWTPGPGETGATLSVKADDGLTVTEGKIVLKVSAPASTLPATPPAQSPAPVPPPPHRPPGAAARASELHRSQRGSTVHGRIEIARPHSRLQVELLAAKSALGRRGHGHVRVGRLVKTASGHASFAVAVDAAARRALRRRGKLALTVRITVTPVTGARYTTTRTVTLHG